MLSRFANIFGEIHGKLVQNNAKDRKMMRQKLRERWGRFCDSLMGSLSWRRDGEGRDGMVSAREQGGDGIFWGGDGNLEDSGGRGREFERL